MSREPVHEPVGEAWQPRETTYDDRLDDVRAPGWEDAASEAAALVPAEAPLAPDDVDGNLRRYARWQWRDYWQRRGFWMAGAALLGVWLLAFASSHATDGGRPLNGADIQTIATLAFIVGGGLAGLLGTGGLVARERERGLQRFLFAKPVGIVRYYLQGLGINAVGSLFVIAGAVALAALVLPVSLPVLGIIGLAMATYALTSGVTFLLSTLLRYDAPIAAAWLAAGFPVTLAAQATLQGQARMWWAVPLQWLFPQGWAIEGVKAAFVPIPNQPTPALFLLGALVAVIYGALCAAGGVAVLRRRSIQT